MSYPIQSVSKAGYRSGSLVGVAVVGLMALAVPGRASAGTITFDVTGTFENGAAFLPGSTVTMDTTLGVATDADLMISAGGNSPAETFSGIPNIHNGYPPFSGALVWLLGDGWDLTINPPPPPSPPPDPNNPAAPGFIGFAGGPVGGVDYFNSDEGAYSGGLTSAMVFTAEVPEPSGISLMGIGLLSLVGLRLRKGRPVN